MFAAVNVTVIVTELVFANTKKVVSHVKAFRPLLRKRAKKKKKKKRPRKYRGDLSH